MEVYQKAKHLSFRAQSKDLTMYKVRRFDYAMLRFLRQNDRQNTVLIQPHVIKTNMEKEGEIILYQPDGTLKLEVRLEDETVWLTQAQIADLFGTQRQAISKHLKNIFTSHELEENSVCSILELTAADGKTYKTKIYNLDAILSVGYRVNSKNTTSELR